MAKAKLMVLCPLLILVMFGCRPFTETPEPSRTATLASPSPGTPTPAQPIKPTDTRQAPATPSRTAKPTLTVTVTPTNVFKLIKATGTIWLGGRLNPAAYLVVDMEKGSWEYRHFYDGCSGFISPYIAICRSEEGLYLLDRRNNSKTELSVRGHPVLSESPGGRYLLHYSDNESGTSWVPLNIIDLSTLVDTQYAKISSEAMDYVPVLSTDGTRLVTINWIGRTSLLVEILPGDDNFRRIVLPGGQFPTEDFVWAPRSARMAIGASDIHIEIGTCLRYIYVLDMQTYKLKLAAQAPPDDCFDNYIYGGSIWSPTEDKLAFPYREKICIYDFRVDSYECFALGDLESDMLTFGWSPDGAYLAYTIRNHETSEDHLGIFDLRSGQNFIIVEDIPQDILRLEWW